MKYLVRKRNIAIKHKQSTEAIVDIPTKPPERARFDNLRKQLGVREIPQVDEKAAKMEIQHW